MANKKKKEKASSENKKNLESEFIESEHDQTLASLNFSNELDFEVEDADIKTDLDPILQKVILSRDEDKEKDPSLVRESSEGELLVDVLAVLHDPKKEVPGLNVTRVIGDVVTGSVEINKIEEIKEDPNVISLKGARKISPQLHISLPEINARQIDISGELRTTDATSIDGSEVIVGIIDFGCGFAHENFLNSDGSTRILYLWDQSGQQNSMSPQEYQYGREFTADEINKALEKPNPYTALSYHPGNRAHGTHVMDIAAGNGRGSSNPGVAPKADIIFVELSTESKLENFGNSRRLLEAVEYVFHRAEELGKSAVVNLSLGTHGGPHDGSTPVERGFDTLLEKENRAVVISAGNSHQRGSHSSGEIPSGGDRTLGWEVFSSDNTVNELEVWYNGDAELEVTLISPSGQQIVTTKLNEVKNVSIQGIPFARIIHRASDPLNGDNHIDIFLRHGLSGVWGVELKTVGNESVNFHAWIERDDNRVGMRNQSRFIQNDDDPTHTIGSISCGKKSIVVGSYNAAVINRDISSFSAEGPSRDGKQKPEISAPGQEILAANSASTSGITSMSGTSMAAPHVTGVVALLMQLAENPLSIVNMREMLSRTARKEFNQTNSVWDSRYGEGRVDTVALLKAQVNQTDSPAAPVHPISLSKEMPYLQNILNLVNNGSQEAKVRLKIEVEFEPKKVVS